VKTYLGELKAYLQATDHTSNNIISRENCIFPLLFWPRRAHGANFLTGVEELQI
jgi:hypothetical protein